MERKIGEIFQVKGRRGQVVEQTNVCDCYGCCFSDNGACFEQDETGECDSANRVDRKEVIFKVLPPLYYLDANRTYMFDFTGKKVKYAIYGNNFSVQTKENLARFIHRMKPDTLIWLYFECSRYVDLKKILLRVLTEKVYTNVQIIK